MRKQQLFLLASAALLAGCGGGGGGGIGGVTPAYQIRFVGNPAQLVYGTKYQVQLYRVDNGQNLLIPNAKITSTAVNGTIYLESPVDYSYVYLYTVDLAASGTLNAQIPNGSGGFTPVNAPRAVNFVQGPTFRADIVATYNGNPAEGLNVGARFQNALGVQIGLQPVPLGAAGTRSIDLPQNIQSLVFGSSTVGGVTATKVVVDGVTYNLPAIVPLAPAAAGTAVTVNVEVLSN